MNKSIHPKAVHWIPAMPNEFGASTGYISEIGSTHKGADGRWHAWCGSEDLGGYRTEKQARKAIIEFKEKGYRT